MRIGYGRVSSDGQSLDIQTKALEGAGCERILTEKLSGTKMDNRAELNGLLAILRPGDEVWITRLDRLARSVGDLIKIVETIEGAGATLHAIEQPIETKTSAGRLFLTILGAFAAFETQIRAERQREGIDKARAALKYKGSTRGPSYDRATIERFYFDHGLSISLIARRLKCSRQTIYRAIEEIRAAKAKAEEKGGA